MYAHKFGEFYQFKLCFNRNKCRGIDMELRLFTMMLWQMYKMTRPHVRLDINPCKCMCPWPALAENRKRNYMLFLLIKQIQCSCSQHIQFSTDNFVPVCFLPQRLMTPICLWCTENNTMLPHATVSSILSWRMLSNSILVWCNYDL